MGFLKWKDWIGGALNVFKETPASDIGEGLIRHEWQGDKYNVQQTGTTLKAYIMNNLQMGLDFLIDSNHTVVNSEDHYVITIDGLKTTTSNPDGYELSENLHFSIKITEENTKGISKLIINGDSYDLHKKENGTLAELNVSDLKPDKVYSVYYDGTRFIIGASLLPATETTAGIISIEEILKYQAVNFGLEYGGKFGTELTEAKEGKIYYLKDDENYKAYLCISDTSNTAGILIPDSNFIEYGLFQDGRRADIFYSGQIDLPNTTTPIATINPIKAKYLVVIYTFVSRQYEITSIVPIDAIDTVQLHFHERLSGVDEGITLTYDTTTGVLSGSKKNSVGSITYTGYLY